MLDFLVQIAFYSVNLNHDHQEVPVSMNKAELVDQVAKTSGLGKREAEAAVTATTYVITTSVRQGVPVRITGFGTFKPRDRKARRGRNPQTGAAVQIKAQKSISFAIGATLKSDLNARSNPPRPPALSSTGSSTTATRTAPAKKAAAKKAPAKRAPAKKAPAKKAPAKKVAARKR
jgi:DNA-binding protein HU-beta